MSAIISVGKVTTDVRGVGMTRAYTFLIAANAAYND
jgi:hypothetical protein